MKKETTSPLTGTIFEIQRMSTEDGPGIRTTVFFKGCTLRCRWCHNPESINTEPEIHWLTERCIGCGTCIDICPEKALTAADDGITIDRSLCSGCGRCAEQCPSTALELLGTEWTIEGLLGELLKDRTYFEKSGGGVTVSGGEAVMQARFVQELLMRLNGMGIHTALDTSGQCPVSRLGMLLPYSDTVLYDIKEIDPKKHKEFTGSGNRVIIDNLRYICDFTRDHILPREIWIRTPVIPGTTATRENISGIGRLLASLDTKKITRWELLCFNNLCGDKYLRLHRDWGFANQELMEEEAMEDLAAAARESGVDPDIVTWTGSTRLSEDSGENVEGKRKGPIRNRPGRC